MSARPIYKRITSIPDGSLHYDVNGWLEKLKLSIPRAAYLDLQAAVDKLAGFENYQELRFNSQRHIIEKENSQCLNASTAPASKSS